MPTLNHVRRALARLADTLTRRRLRLALVAVVIITDDDDTQRPPLLPALPALGYQLWNPPVPA